MFTTSRRSSFDRGQRQRREGPRALGEVPRDRTHLEPREQRPEGRDHLGHHRVLADVEVCRAGSGCASTIGSIRGRHCSRAATVSAERLTAVTRGVARHAEAGRRRGARRAAPTPRGAGARWAGVRVAVLAARDVERQLGGRREPRVGALLAEQGEDVAEHAAEGLSLTATNLECAGEGHVRRDGPYRAAQEGHVRLGVRGRQVERRERAASQVRCRLPVRAPVMTSPASDRRCAGLLPESTLA